MQTHNEDILTDILQFYRRYCEDEIAELAEKYPSEKQSVVIDWMDLYRYDKDIAEDLLKDPSGFGSYFDEALQMYDLPIDIDLTNASVRVKNLTDAHTFDVGSYRSNNIGKYIAVTGQVAKTTQVEPLPEEVAFVCQRCGTITRVPQQGRTYSEPHECEGCERQGPFRVDESQSDFGDHQLIRLQRPPEQTKGGQDVNVDVHMNGDLVGEVQPGDRVTVTSQLVAEEPSSEDQLTFDTYLDASSVSVTETDYEDIDVDEHIDEIERLASGAEGDPYELLIQSVAPTVEGMEVVKKAIVLQMFGGIRAELPDGSHKRGDPHILLLGDPGTAKSTLLEKVEKIAPRSTYASGKGATAAGLTAAAERDDFGPQEWSLSAGALVLADKGIACVDEIDKVDESAVESMHEALSKQQVHVNKAGINARLPTRTALLAAGNPKYGRFDPHMEIAEQIELGPTLLSRFDLLFMVNDSPSEEEDDDIIQGMIESRRIAAEYTDDPHAVDESELEKISPKVPTEVMRAWIAHAKRTVIPKFAPYVEEELKETFKELRLANGEDPDAPVPVTFRKLEGFQRLAEASARVRLSETVEMQDLERARELIERSMEDVEMDTDDQLDADIVEAGQSKDQRDRIKNIEGIIQHLESEHREGAPVDLVIERAEEVGISKGKCEHEIEKLKQKGTVYEPQSDHLRTT